MKILVTGASGFVGGHLVKDLIHHQHDVVAIGHNNRLVMKDIIQTYEIDILDEGALKDCLQNEKPEGIIHLAAQSNVQKSWEKTRLTIDVNINGTMNMLKALAEVCPQARFLNIGSSDEYGLTAKQGIPLTEDMPCLPQNPYSISKLCSEQMALQFAQRYDLQVVHLRSFNHFGPGQQKGFVISDFASQIAAIEHKRVSPILCVGDLSVYRDFTFIDDVVRAYRLLMESNSQIRGVYNICSGKARQVEQILYKLIGMSTEKIEVIKDKSKFRQSEVSSFVGCADKLKSIIRWEINNDFDDNLLDTLNWWRKNI